MATAEVVDNVIVNATARGHRPMGEIEDHLFAQAARHLEELDARIVRQREIVARLRSTDDQRHAGIARDLLAAFETSRGLALRHLRRHHSTSRTPVEPSK